MIIKENTICYASERGHKNFFYPSCNKLIIKEEYNADRLSWISGSDKIAVRIPKEFLTPLDLAENTASSFSPPAKNIHAIVWIEKCLLN